MKTRCLLLLSLVFLAACKEEISDFQSQNFIKFFGSGTESKGNSVIALPDGGYVFTGYDKINNNNQVFAAKVDQYGNTIWNSTWGNNNNEIGKKILALYDNAQNITGYLILGTTVILTSGYTHSFVMKIDAYGSQDSIWYKEFGGTNFNLILNDFTVTDDGSIIYLAGSTNVYNANESDTYIAKLNQNGEILWDDPKSKSGGSESFNKIFLNSSGNPLLVGNDNSKIMVTEYIKTHASVLYSFEVLANESGKNFLDALYSNNELIILFNLSNNLNIIKVDVDVNPVWQYPLTSALNNGRISFLTDGAIIISGETGGSTSFFRVDDSGASAEVYSGQALFKTISGELNSMIKTIDKGLVMVGATASTYGTMVQLIKTDKNLYLLKL